MASKINIGVRHVLPIYPPLAVLGGYAAALLLEHRGRFWISALGVLCVASVVVESVVAHPDYLAYFNPIAFSHPERVLCETDLDWGQDLFRLAERLKSLGIQRIALKYYGTAPPEVAGLTSYRELSPTVPVSGYVAISIRDLELENARDGSYGWLKSRQPLERVGRSIFLYYIP